jgi:thiol:disulfide interchange protein DsbA
VKAPNHPVPAGYLTGVFCYIGALSDQAGLPDPGSDKTKIMETTMLLSLRLALLLLACCSLTANAQPRESIEGIHYQTLARPVPTETDADHIELRDIFWYGCPECATLEPMMTDWRDGTTGDLVFARMPAIWNDLMALHARIYYTGKVLEAEDRIHQAAFHAIHEAGNPLRTEAQIAEFFAANGFNSDTFTQAWNSTEVTDAVQQARLRTADYGIDKLPTAVVNGAYKVVHNAKVFNHVEYNLAFNMVIYKLRVERRSDFATSE